MSGILEWRQRGVDPFEAMQTHLDGRQSQIHTGMPGVIVSFDPVKMTAVVQPALQGMQRNKDGTTEAITITKIPDVPVHFPGGGGHTLTFPVKAGDECWIAFSERNLDNWHQQGGVQRPGDYRMHDINDCVAHVGLRSQQSLPEGGANPNTVQLRSDDGRSFIELDGAGGKMTMKCPLEITLDVPKVTVTGIIDVKGQGGGSGNVATFAGSLAATGEVISRSGGGSVNLPTHTHPAHNTSPNPGT